MNTTGLARYGGALVALAVFSACGGGSAVAPSSATPNIAYVGGTLTINGRPVTAALVNVSTLPRYMTIVPDHRSRTPFEYIFNTYGSYASIFRYPRSNAQVGSINGDGGQGCANVLYGYGKNIFWNVGGPSQITEYSPPQHVIKTLTISPSLFPTSCAMNTSGDLAVGIYGTADGGDVFIFKNASGTPTVYKTALDEEFFDGYDPQGDLFADGFTGNRSGFALVELPKGASKFETITTSNSVQFPGSVQWDGTYLDVTDQIANAVYQYTVSGTRATLKNTITLAGSSDCAQTWLAPGVLYCADAGNGNGEVFKYPAGGSPIATFTGNFDVPLGVTAAKK